ncbi:MAG: hypothetical protein BEN19_00385 [Epulopiscium sp. Nuni2H_MBin003]|nr:MAG: hypothetical protein BEN19_00385 [Epulopiscium sp. Nuni2H_MBin003]
MAQIDLSDINRRLDVVKEELYLNSIASKAKSRIIYRGEVYKCKFSSGIGNEQNKERPCVIIQNNTANKKSGNTIVAPITHTGSNVNTVVKIETQTDSNNNIILDGYVLAGNIMTVSKARLGDKLGSLSKADMRKIDETIPLAINKEYVDKKNNLLRDKEDHVNNLNKKIIELNIIIEKQFEDLNKWDKLKNELNCETVEDLRKLMEKLK